jgi:predicted enzyme related to lactoylglutathione lyase
MLAVVIDCEDPSRLAGFWHRSVGGVINTETASPGWVEIEGIAGLGYLAFQRVPEPKRIKNRVHLDYLVDDLDAMTTIAIEGGAVVVGEVVEEQTNRFQVMRDPEGNEFCLVSVLG